MVDDPWASVLGPPTKSSDDPWASVLGAPVNQDKQSAPEESPWYTKAAKGLASAALRTSIGQSLAYGAAETRTKDANTLRKSGALGVNPDQIDKNTEWLKQQAGLENYDPASAHFADSSKPWTERIGYLPRTLLEGVPTMAQHIAASSLAGPVGMLGSTALSEGGTSVDRVREADKTDPNAELTPQQKLRVGGNIGLQAILNEVGGRATLGATAPVKTVGMEGVKQAAGNVVKAAGIDAAVGGYGAGADKALIEGQVPSAADVALSGLAGATVGTAFRGPNAARDAAVATRFKALGDIDPQSRGDVANLLNRYDGNFSSVNERLNKDLSTASKGLDDNTKMLLADAKIKVKNGQRLDPEDIQTVSSASPDAGRVMQNIDTFGVMKGLDNGGVSGSAVGRLLNPFQRAAHGDAATTLGRFAEGASLGHMFWAHDPTTAAAVLGGQALGTGLLHGVDRFTGAYNPAKVITDRYSTGTSASPVAQAKAAARIKKTAGDTTVEPNVQAVTNGDYNISTKHGDLSKNEADDLFSKAGRIAGTNRRVDSREAFMNKASDLNISDEAKNILAENKDNWNQELLHNASTREEAKSFLDNEVLSNFSPEDQKILRDHFENGKVTLEGDKKAMPYFMTWKHKTLEDLQKHKERMANK